MTHTPPQPNNIPNKELKERIAGIVANGSMQPMKSANDIMQIIQTQTQNNQLLDKLQAYFLNNQVAMEQRWGDGGGSDRVSAVPIEPLLTLIDELRKENI